MKFEKGFVNCDGKYFDNVYVVDKSKLDDLSIVTCSHYSDQMDSFSSDGCSCMQKHVYKSTTHPNMCIRIYGDYGESNFPYPGSNEMHVSNLSLISDLMKRQKLVKCAKFPYGIVTNNNHIIGDISYFWNNYSTFKDVIKNHNLDEKKVLLIYKQILNALKELKDAGIYYRDVHSGNFMLNKDLDNAIVIDFDPAFVSLDSKLAEDIMMKNYSRMVDLVNHKYNIEEFKEVLTLDDALCQVEESLVKKRK